MWDRIGVALLFGLAANIDNVSIGFAYGAKHRHIRWHSNLLIALITTLVTLLTLGGGVVIRRVLPSKVPDLLGGSLLLLLALWTIHTEYRGGGDVLSRTPDRFTRQQRVGLIETLSLAAVLSINNIGLAIAGGLGGLDYRVVAPSVGGFSIVLLLLGQRAGCSLMKVRLPRMARACLNGNVILILVGLMMLAGY